MAIDNNIQKGSAFIMFTFSGILFIAGCALTYYMISLGYDLISIIKNVSPIISGSIAMLYLGLIMYKTHRIEKNILEETNKKMALYVIFIFIGSVISVVGFIEEIWGVCALGIFLALSFLNETYKIYKKNKV